MRALTEYFDLTERMGDDQKRGRKKRATAHRIFMSALELMRYKGYEDVSIEEICDKAEIARATFFQHFSNKSELMSVASDIVRQRVEVDLLNSEANARECLFLITEHLKNLSNELGAVAPEMFSAFTATKGGGFKIEQPGTGISAMIVRIVEQGQDAGEFSKEWPPEIVAVSLVSAWVGVVRHHIAIESADEGDSLSEVLRLLLVGLEIR